MEDTNIDVYNKISECEGLETLFTVNLQKCEYKSDVVILYAHHLLTQELHYEYAELQVESDENGEQKEVYKTVDTLPTLLKKDFRSYKNAYKTEKENRFLTAQKNNREIVVYFSNKAFDKNKFSSKIILNNYIPNQFLETNDLSLIENLSELRNILLACFSKTDKIKAKREHDKDWISSGPSKVAKRDETPRITDDTSNNNSALRNLFDGSLCYPKRTNNKGGFTLQKKDKHVPIDQNKINGFVVNDLNMIMAEYPDGPPDQIYLT